MSYWIDIENEPAPTEEGKPIIVRNKVGSAFIGCYDEAQGLFFVGFNGYGDPEFVDPTHWHPLPEFHPWTSNYEEAAP